MTGLPHNFADAASQGSAQLFRARLLRADDTTAARGMAHVLAQHSIATFWPVSGWGHIHDPAEVKAVNLGDAMVISVCEFKRCPIGSEHYHFSLELN